MKCPNCKHEMEKGFLQSSRQMVWSPFKKKLLPSKYNKKTDVRVSTYFDFASEAYVCRKCRKIVVEYEDLK